jgi:hypothetical protein
MSCFFVPALKCGQGLEVPYLINVFGFTTDKASIVMYASSGLLALSGPLVGFVIDRTKYRSLFGILIII